MRGRTNLSLNGKFSETVDNNLRLNVDLENFQMSWIFFHGKGDCCSPGLVTSGCYWLYIILVFLFGYFYLKHVVSTKVKRRNDFAYQIGKEKQEPVQSHPA